MLSFLYSELLAGFLVLSSGSKSLTSFILIVVTSIARSDSVSIVWMLVCQLRVNGTKITVGWLMSLLQEFCAGCPDCEREFPALFMADGVGKSLTSVAEMHRVVPLLLLHWQYVI